jgi:hypothetical protein
MKHIKSVDEFTRLYEQLFAADIAKFNKLMGISVEETGQEEPNIFGAENPSGMGTAFAPVVKLNTNQLDTYGSTVGINEKGDNSDLNQPLRGPLGNIVNSAYANLNVSTRRIPGTNGGNLGCAAAVSIIFYRATGYAIAGSGAITLGTGHMWSHLDKESKDPNGVWQKITNWKTESQPGDIILTARASKAGHVGVVVEGGNIISNSSGGFQGDKKGQVELNYNLNTWDSVANRNPQQTASFRYKGPYKKEWGKADRPVA